MYAIIEDGGKQYKVAQGEVVCVETRELTEGQQDIEFDRVLMVSDDDGAVIGQPIVAGAKVQGKISHQAAGPKVFAMQFRRRKDSQRRVGHRQKYLAVEITGITKP